MDDKKPKKLRELESRLVEEWLVEEWKISAIEIQKLIATMPDRIQAVLANIGGHTK